MLRSVKKNVSRKRQKKKNEYEYKCSIYVLSVRLAVEIGAICKPCLNSVKREKLSSVL